MYSKRERKPKVWAGFETEAPSENQRDRIQHNEQVDKDKVTENKSDKNNSPVKKDMDYSTTSVKKGKRKSQKLNITFEDDSSEKVENDTNSIEKFKGVEEVLITKGTTELKNNEEKKRKVNKFVQPSQGFGDDLDEKVPVSEEELESIRQAVESKRTTKYIEKCDRVMVRQESKDTTKLEDDSTPVKHKAIEENDSKNNKGQSKSNEANDSNTIKIDSDISNTGSQKKTPGRKRGRPKKAVIEDSSEQVEATDKDLDQSNEKGNLNDDTDLDESARLLSTPVSAPVRKRGKRKMLDEGESPQEKTLEHSFVTPVSTSKQRGRKKKSQSDASDEIEKELNKSQGSSRKGRKRKEINYAAMEDGDDLKEESTELPAKKRGRKRKEVNYAAVDDGDEIEESEDQNEVNIFDKDDEELDYEDDVSFTSKKTPSRKTPSKQVKNLQCKHCDYHGKTVIDIRKHYAISHQLWWTEENPEGIFDKSCWANVFKLKKFLNCTKCDKQINFVTYYPNHFEWCGREHLTYTCEHCEKDNLVLRWQQLHLKTCPALLAQLDKERRTEESRRRKEEMKMMEETEDSGRGRQRKAAKKARTMVHNISKDMEPTAESDKSDDPDVVLNDDDENDDEEEDDNIDDDDDINEDDVQSPNENDYDDDIVADDDYDVEDDNNGKNPYWNRAGHFNPHPLMEKFVEENWSEQLFLDWVPLKKDWKQLSQEESEPYLPKMKASIRFSFHGNKSPSTLHTLQSTTIDDFPLFYTGLSIWDLAWCPTSLTCTDGQFLAVTGKTDHAQMFLTDQRWTGPGLIQIWFTGIQNNKLKSKAVPSLQFNMVHDFGLATQMLWCPSGCYKSNENQTEAESYTRLGLLAVCFTDGTCRIFSVPLMSTASDGVPQTYKVKPVITLMSCNDHEGGSYTCSAMDWIKTQGHSKIILGYSSGAIKLFNLLSRSPLQRITSNDEVRLFPYLNLQPHGNLVRAVQFCSLFENIIVTSSEDFETIFFDLTNLGAPIHCDSGSYMPICMFSSLWQHGVFSGSDENYAVLANRARYIDSGHVLFFGAPAHRKDERGAYYISLQPACIWDIECSEWVGLVVSSDNRGCIAGLTLKDFLKISPDCKTYKFRQLLLQTIIKEDTVIKEEHDTKENSSSGVDQSGQCKKCANIQSKETLPKDNSGKDQSEISVQCTCDKTDQSTREKDLSNEIHSDIKVELNEGDNKTKTSVIKSKNGKTLQNYQELVNNSVLHFKENFKVPKYVPNDKNSDRYDRPSIAAIKSVSLNPNKHQCCWLAYGGNTGLVRLVNVQKNFAKVTEDYLRQKHQI
ncbi:uncharacterized protein LOC132724362 isoform X2 [Ruditapes philippinarum]|uniref:uncharacterized protein LOC132724362 isoform X2 n=1 Tax=Ruditapes philippinarum TaxID=129788 RepID=UPI00295C14D5|nr:uncharacterized protein LOC132724362 isoform X2 [Ruditapes philippinarum]